MAPSIPPRRYRVTAAPIYAEFDAAIRVSLAASAYRPKQQWGLIARLGDAFAQKQNSAWKCLDSATVQGCPGRVTLDVAWSSGQWP